MRASPALVQRIRPAWAGFALLLAVVAWQAALTPPVARLLHPAPDVLAHAVALLLPAVLGAAGFAFLLRLERVRTLRSASTVPGLGECEHQLLALADALPVGVLVVRGEHVHAANAPAGHMLQIDPARLAQRPVQRLFAEPAAGAALLSGGPAPSQVLDLQRADGSRLRAEVGIRAFRLGRRDLRVLFLSDLSERERAQAQIARQHEELQAMARRLLSVQEDERSTLSRELHDDIGQQITAIKLGAMALQGETDPQRRAETLEEIIAITDQTVAKVRNLSLLLRPPQLDALGLEAALRWQTGVLFRSGRPALELAIEPLDRRPPRDVELACFRIAQEALTNVLRHADAQHVRLGLAARNGALV
ncbi:MAG TPA: histidine kinase, partial [Lysobacter sp.]